MRKIEARFSSGVPLPGILTMSVNLFPATPPVDGRQSPTALAIARGTTRYLHALGYCVVSELPLPSGRRADLVALGGDGEVLIIEIKSSIADFRADQKWMEYRLHCDRLFFATVVDVRARFFRRTPDCLSPTLSALRSCARRPSTGSFRRAAGT
jgi:hypothetical protein